MSKTSPSTLAEVFELSSEIEGRIGNHFAQHILVERCWNELATHFEGKSTKERRRLLKLRCDFHRSVYPGLNGAHAWVLEAYADSLLDGDPDFETACTVLSEEFEILSLLFGSSHKYPSQVATRL